MKTYLYRASNLKFTITFLAFVSCGSQFLYCTLYVGLARAVPPTNTNFQPLLLPTQAGMPYTNTHKHRMLYFKSTLTFIGPAKRPYRSPTKTGNSCDSFIIIEFQDLF